MSGEYFSIDENAKYPLSHNSQNQYKNWVLKLRNKLFFTQFMVNRTPVFI